LCKLERQPVVFAWDRRERDAEGARRQILAALAICDRLALLAMFGRHCGFGRATL
jgi:hypothetical protein